MGKGRIVQVDAATKKLLSTFHSTPTWFGPGWLDLKLNRDPIQRKVKTKNDMKKVIYKVNYRLFIHNLAYQLMNY